MPALSDLSRALSREVEGPALLIFLFGIALGILIVYVFFSIKHKRPIKSSSEFSSQDAEALLKNNGYKIIISREPKSVIITIDGKTHLSTIQADYIVEKEKKKYAVLAAANDPIDPTEPALRRKLIEIKNAFPDHNILFADLKNGEIHEVNFSFPKSEANATFTIIIILTIIFAVMGLIAFLIQAKLI